MGRITYTDEMVARLREVYQPGDTEESRVQAIELLMAEFEAPKSSVIGKLTTEQLYVPLVKVDKPKVDRGPTRLQLAKVIAAEIGLEVSDIPSFERINKKDLVTAVEALVGLSAKEAVQELADS